MRAFLLALLVWQVAGAPAPEQRYFQDRRAVIVAPGSGSGQACATLDGAVFAHAAPSLKDVRLYEGKREVPYAITLSESAEADSEPATVLNLGLRGAGPLGTKIVFDLAMPDRAYTDVLLDLDGQDFIASAEVSGTNQSGETPTRLGTFTLFDLTGQHLSRSTTLHLQESRFHTLHVELSVSPAPGPATLSPGSAMVKGASVPPNRESQTVYTTVAATSQITQRGHQTIAVFRLPAHVPVEQVSFALPPGFSGNFSRDVQVSDRAEGTPPESAAETQNGTILRVRLTQAGHEIRQQQLSVPATLGANLQKDALVEVLINNGDDRPLPISAVSLEMRERRLCFNVPAAPGLTLFYGDAALDAPVYDFARLLTLSRGFAAARLGAEERNPAYMVRPLAERSLTERHPELLWIVLLAVVCVLAAVATHSAKKMPK